MSSCPAELSADRALENKVRFLLSADNYPKSAAEVRHVETHMSHVFLAGDRAYKLKKPIKLPFLDFSTIEKRERMCRQELLLNRRMAPHLYLEVVPLSETDGKLRLGSGEHIVDWLVVLQRLDERLMLDSAIANRQARAPQLLRLTNRLAEFYRHAHPVFISPARYLAKWRQVIRSNRHALLHPDLSLPVARVLELDRIQSRFLDCLSGLLLQRLKQRKIVDGHGDLRPEHIWLGEPLAVIDCLEFNAELRAIDPFEELAYLAVECERFGDTKIGSWIIQRLGRILANPPPPELLSFYKCYRATLRANLSAVHLLEKNPRTPEKWRPLALRYLEIARKETATLERAIKNSANRPIVRPDANAILPARKHRRLKSRPVFGVWNVAAETGKSERYHKRQCDLSQDQPTPRWRLS